MEWVDGLRPSRILANIVGMMLFVQVILGGSALLYGIPVLYHLVWGVLTFILLIATTGIAVREYGRRSNLFKVGIVSVVIFFIQGLLGLAAFGSNLAILVHLTNAFVLAVLVTYFISFADSADKSALAATAAAAKPS